MARLTPRDIQEKEFRSGLRGYKEEEVDEFLDRVTGSYEEVFKENIDLKEEVERLLEENKKYELIGERMQAALVAAQETADDVRKNATKEAENILREAEIKAHKMVQESRDQHRELQKSLAIIKQIEEEFRFKLKSMLQSYIKLLDEVALGDAKEIKKHILPEDMAALDERRKPPAETPTEKPAKIEDTAARKAKEEDTKAKAAAILEEIAQKAAVEKEAQASADMAKAASPEAPAAKPAAIEAPAPKPAEKKEEKVEKKEEKKEAPAKEIAEVKTAAEPPFDKEAGKASAVAAEWDTLETAVKEAQKESEKQAEAKEGKEPAAEEKKEAKKEQPASAEATAGKPVSAEDTTGKTAEGEAKAEKAAEKPPAKTEEKSAAAEVPEAKPEEKPAIAEAPADKPKGGKVNLEDIEIVEDESFWKDI